MAVDVKRIGERVAAESALVNRVRTSIQGVIIGQKMLVDV